MSANQVTGALAGLRVLDVSQMLAGPICAMRLGDLGADVVKVEPPGVGEWTRTHGFAGAEIGGETTAQLGLNRNKRSVTLNLKNPAGRAVFLRLVRVSDVVLQNFRVGTATRLGIGWDACHEVNPQLVYCSISGYGADGPLADRPGQDLLLQGYSGSMFSVGSSEDPPQPGALWAADVMTGYQAAIGILAALRHRDASGVGQHVEVDMLSVVMDAQSQELTTHLNLGLEPTRTRAPLAHAWMNAPYGVYRSGDGWMVLAMTDLNLLGAALGNDWLLTLDDWADGVQHRDAVYDVVVASLTTRTTEEWLKIFDIHKVWAGPVLTYAELVTHPHVVDRGLIASVEHPTAGTVYFPAPPLRLSATPASVRMPPPLLGEHTDDVLAEYLGIGRSELTDLRGKGAL